MAWTTAFGNNQRDSDCGVATDISSELWTYTFASPETPFGPPVVSVGGYIWIMSVDTTGNDYTQYLYCLNSDGTLKSKTTLQTDNVNPNTTGRLSVLVTQDVCLVPWQSSLKAYDVDGNLSWEYTVSGGADTTITHVECPLVMADDSIIMAWSQQGASSNAQKCFITTLDSSGAFVSEFDTGYGLLLYTEPMICCDATSIYIAQLAGFPVGGSTHVYLNKFSFAGSLTWTYDLGTFLSFKRLLVPSVRNGKVLVYGANSAINGLVNIFQVDATAGTLDWTFVGDSNDYANGKWAPPVASDGTVYGGHFGDTSAVTPTVHSVEDAGGTENWQFDDPIGTSNSPGGTPIIGSDGYIIFWDQSLYRLVASGGSIYTQIDTLNIHFQPAVVTDRVYVPISLSVPLSLDGAIRAYGPTPSVSAGHGMRTIVRVPFRRYRRGAVKWGRSPNFGGKPNPANIGIAFEVYVARIQNNQQLSSEAYGSLTYFLIDVPVADKTTRIVKQLVDIDGMQPGDKVELKVRRDGDDPNDPSDTRCTLTNVGVDYHTLLPG